MIESIEKGRKEDGNRSIADKILKRLHDLEKTVETNHGRWAWELLQNAKDSVATENERKVSVQIKLYNGKIIFKHNGKRFSEKDVRGIINQISSKEIEEGEETKQTGRFGTGFLTTHILSKVITIRGILETENGDLYKFKFPLDREGKTTTQLIPEIEKAWSSFHESATLITKDYDKDDFNTSYTYVLDSELQQEIAEKGIEEFSQLIPYVLTFIPAIKDVTIIDKVEETEITYCTKSHSDFLEQVTYIERTKNNETENIYILYSSNDKVAIAAELLKDDDGYKFKNISKIPKLFCDFPLIGTENFHFPMVVNSFYFNPLTERDGIWLKGDTDKEVQENKQLLLSAVDLYKSLIEEIAEQNYFHFYNVVNTKLPLISEKYLDADWYLNNIQKTLRSFIIQQKIVELEDRKEKGKINDIWFPSKNYTKAIQQNIWQFNYDLYPDSVCCKKHSYKWSSQSHSNWNELTYSELVSDLSKIGSISKLSETLKKDEYETYKWYNRLCEFLYEDDSNVALFARNAITPNQNGDFKKKGELFIDKIDSKELIEILQLLGDDWKDLLLIPGVGKGEYYVKKRSDIAAQITQHLNNSRQKDEDAVKAISLLSEWFENNAKESKEIFADLYRKRAELFMNTITDKESLYKVMRSKTALSKLSEIAETLETNPALITELKKSEELDILLSDFNVDSVSEIRDLLANSRGSDRVQVEITPDILVNLAITTPEELEELFEDKYMSAAFKHTSTPNAEMFVKAQRLISRAKANVKKHLKTLPQKYDCSEMEDIATTVIGGIKKEGLEIQVVVRPSDNGEVIVYYSSEKDTLDLANTELWIDNGVGKPKHLTLGHILKKTGINKIPV
nr:hypothetical protein [uncultured Carboxylicivirga sp.]